MRNYTLTIFTLMSVGTQLIENVGCFRNALSELFQLISQKYCNYYIQQF